MSEERSILRGISRGIGHRCPNCGRGKLFARYLKVQACPACGHDNLQYPADDGPPYFTILLVGHIMVAPLLVFPFIWQAPTALVLGTTLPAVLVLTLVLLPTVKGGVIGLLWALDKGVDPVVQA